MPSPERYRYRVHPQNLVGRRLQLLKDAILDLRNDLPCAEIVPDDTVPIEGFNGWPDAAIEEIEPPRRK